MVLSKVFYQKKSTYFQYSDEALLTYPCKTTLLDLVDKLKIESILEFTYKTEINKQTIHYLSSISC